MKSPALAALALGLTTTPLFAVPAAANPNTVSYGDLDLESQAGKAELENRIAAVARRLCANEIQTGTRLNSKACKAEVRSEILARIEKSQNRVGKGG